MGQFYVNHAIRVPQAPVVAFLEKDARTAFVSPTIQGYTVVFDRECDDQDTGTIRTLGRKLSATLGSPVVAFLNHDDDFLCYWVFEDGELIEEYNSCPDYFDEDDLDEEEVEGVAPPGTCDGEELCRLFGRPAVRQQVRRLLKRAHEPFASSMHHDLVTVLGLPACTVDTGYRYLLQGDAALAPAECVHVGRQAERRAHGDTWDG